jgi:signal peptidase I
MKTPRDAAFEVVGWMVFAISVTLLAVTFGFTITRVDGESMEPTLEDHDRLIVDKLAYEVRDPQRGDVVTLYYPPIPSRIFLKRLIAIEGDTVRIAAGHVYVNGRMLHDEYVRTDFRGQDDWGPQVIPRGYGFVLGDHRNLSFDSRQWGLVPKRYILGRVKICWWPLRHARIF